MVLAQLVRDSLENTGGHTGGEYRATLVENTEPHWSRLEAGKCIVYRGRLASVDLHSSCVAAHQLYLAAGSARPVQEN